MDRILVATDFSAAAGKAFAQAVALARGHETEVHVLHRLVSPIPLFPPDAHPGLGGFAEMGRLLDDYTAELRKDASKRLEELAASAPEGLTLSTSVEDSLEAHEAILRKAMEWKADLIAMGSHGRQGLDRVLMGSVASSVLHRADAHVLLVRADSEVYDGERALGPIVVPVDFSDYSIRALGLARSLAARYDGTVHLLHVVELLHTPFKPAGLTSRFETEPGLSDRYREALSDMLGDTPGEVTVAEGSVAGEILWWREKMAAHLVVMGSRGLSGLKHLLLGSVAEKVARFCEVPVIVVK